MPADNITVLLWRSLLRREKKPYFAGGRWKVWGALNVGKRSEKKSDTLVSGTICICEQHLMWLFHRLGRLTTVTSTGHTMKLLLLTTFGTWKTPRILIILSLFVIS